MPPSPQHRVSSDHFGLPSAAALVGVGDVGMGPSSAFTNTRAVRIVRTAPAANFGDRFGSYSFPVVRIGRASWWRTQVILWSRYFE